MLRGRSAESMKTNSEFSSRKKERRNIPCFADPDRRKSDRRGSAQREIDKKRRKEFERHLSTQR